MVFVFRMWHTGIGPIVGLLVDQAAQTLLGLGFPEGTVLHLQLHVSVLETKGTVMTLGCF